MRQTSPSVDPDDLRKRGLARSLVGWVVMIGLLLLVAAGSYVGVTALIGQIGRSSAPNLPSLPGLPSADAGGGPFEWVQGLFRHDEIYIVNLAEGLNLRSQPDVNDPSNILTVVANGTPVTRLDGPLMKDNIPWLRVSAEVGGTHYEGWMSLNFLRQEQ
jgi:hypothetical protein